MLSHFRAWSAGSKRLAGLFLAVVLPAAVTLVWLGVQLLAQDRRLWAERELEQREVAADVVVRELSRRLAEAEAALSDGGPPDGTVMIAVAEGGIVATPADAVLWLPAPPALPEERGELFTNAERAEFRRIGDRGLAVYRKLRRSSDPAIHAGALLRLARVHRTSGELAEAIQYYRELARVTTVAVNGTPADLIARRAVCALLQQRGDRAALAAEVASLETDLLSGRWALDRGAWTLAAEDIALWMGRPPRVSVERRLLTEALALVWHRRGTSGQPRSASFLPARDAIDAGGQSVLVLARGEGEGLRLLLVGPAVVARWALDAVPAELVSPQALVLADAGGRIVAGSSPDARARLVRRLTTETGLPWTVALKPRPAADRNAAVASRRRLLAAGLGALVILLGAGSYLLWRTVQRELAVARMQTEFVSAVSHEFRTPLTALQHVTELLEEDDDVPRERRQSLYAALTRNTERLRGLVESLLDFARMEEGRRPYVLETVDPVPTVSDLVDEFRRHAAEGTSIRAALAPPGTLRCRADPARLRHALWNLLDNAVKYSQRPASLCVSVRQEGSEAAIAVTDSGYGIPAGERRRVFDRFVRGSETTRRGIQGTGLGLAIVAHIVSAHGGRIQLESEEGKGSTFTILLPLTSAPPAVSPAADEQPAGNEARTSWRAS